VIRARAHRMTGFEAQNSLEGDIAGELGNTVGLEVEVEVVEIGVGNCTLVVDME
jgi:hypothetical protein